MKTRVLFLLIVLLLPSCLVSASPTARTVALDTGEVDLLYGIRVQITLNFDVQLSRYFSSIRPGESGSWNTQITSGTLNIAVFIPSPIDSWYSTSQDLQATGWVAGFSNPLYAPIVMGLSATLGVTPSASLNVDGPASLTTASVSFHSMELPEVFDVTANSNAQHGDVITVNEDFKLDLRIGLSIDMPLFRQQIAEIPIGSFSMNPRVSESTTVSVLPVSVPFFDQLINSLIMYPIVWLMPISILILIILLAIGIVRANRKRRQYETRMKREKERNLEIPKSSPPTPLAVEKTPTLVGTETKIIYCIYCGEQNPSYAVYCRKCGKNLV